MLESAAELRIRHRDYRLFIGASAIAFIGVRITAQLCWLDVAVVEFTGLC